MKQRYIRPELEAVVAVSQQFMEEGLSMPSKKNGTGTIPPEVDDPNDILGKEDGLFGGNLWDD